MYQISPKFQWRKGLNPSEPLKEVLKQRTLFGMLFRNNLTAKFRHSLLGVLWLFIPPVCVLLIYVYMFSYVFKLRWPETELSSKWSFGLAVYAGITVFSAFSESVMGSLNLLVSRAGSIKRCPFPLLLLPVSLACANMLVSTVILLLLGVFSVISGGGFSWLSLLAFPLVVLPFLLLTIGCSWISAALGLFFRDLGNLMGILMLLLFFSTPIFYSLKMIPESFHPLLKLNPLTPAVVNIRDIFLKGLPPDWTQIFLYYLIGIAVFQAGYCFFSAMRRRFADVV